MLNIHTGTDDHGKDFNTIKKVKKFVGVIKEIDKNNYVEIAFSGIVHREDRDRKDKIGGTNKKLESYCASARTESINNDNIDCSCLSRSKLHLNCKCSLISKIRSKLIFRVR